MAIRGGLSYPGGKWRVLDRILPLVPEGVEDWREPFFGGGSVTLGFLQSNKSKDCKRLVVGDLATEIWAYWQGAKMHGQQAAEVARAWFLREVPTHAKLQGMETEHPDYEKVREQVVAEGLGLWKQMQEVDTTQLDLAQRCARTFLTNRISFSGMGDSGSMSKDQLCKFKMAHINKITDVQPLLQRVEILNETFQVTMADTDKDKSFVFLDPPYYAQEGSGLYGRNGDTHHGFPHKEFAEFTRAMNCKWLMTYDDSPFVRKMFRGNHIVPYKFDYTLAGKKSDDALAGEELFIANYPIESDASYEDISDCI